MKKDITEIFRKIDKILNKIPVSLNLLTVILSILMFFGVIPIPFDPNYTEYNKFNYAVYEITNTIFTLTLGVLCYRLKFCAYNWVSVISLFLMNVINLIGIFNVMDTTVYYFAYMNILILALTVLSIILYIAECYNPKNKDT